MPFNRPTLQTIAARTKTDLQDSVGTAGFYRRSVERALNGAIAGTSHQLHGHLAWIALQLDPRSADDDMVERIHGEPYGVYKKAAEFTQLTFEAAGSNGTTVDIGTVWVRSDGARYTTDASVVVSGGIATLALTAEEAGDSYNCEDGDELELESPIVGMTGTGEVTATTNEGTDRETAEDYLVRVLARHQTPPRGGAEGDYVEWALEVAGITRAWEFPRQEGAGTVTVYVVNDEADPITVSGGKLTEVADYIDEPGRQPSTADVYVYTPTLVEVDVTVALTPNTLAVQQAVEAELVALFERIGTPGGMTVSLSQIDEAISIAAGETSHVMTVPAADVVVPFGSLPVLGTVTPV